MASLAPHPGEVTYGSVAELTYKEKEALDEYEGGYVIAPTWSHDPTVLPRAQCYQPRHRHHGLGQRQRDLVRRVVEQRNRMQQHGWSGLALRLSLEPNVHRANNEDTAERSWPHRPTELATGAGRC